MWLGAFGKRKYLHPVSGKYQLDEDYYHSDEEEEESEEEEAELEDKPHEAEVSTIPTAAQKPVQNLDHVRGNDMYLDKWVAQVTISYVRVWSFKTIQGIDSKQQQPNRTPKGCCENSCLWNA